jgi:hypothetical protein
MERTTDEGDEHRYRLIYVYPLYLWLIALLLIKQQHPIWPVVGRGEEACAFRGKCA